MLQHNPRYHHSQWYSSNVSLLCWTGGGPISRTFLFRTDSLLLVHRANLYTLIGMLL